MVEANPEANFTEYQAVQLMPKSMMGTGFVKILVAKVKDPKKNGDLLKEL